MTRYPRPSLPIDLGATSPQPCEVPASSPNDGVIVDGWTVGAGFYYSACAHCNWSDALGPGWSATCNCGRYTFHNHETGPAVTFNFTSGGHTGPIMMRFREWQVQEWSRGFNYQHQGDDDA